MSSNSVARRPPVPEPKKEPLMTLANGRVHHFPKADHRTHIHVPLDLRTTEDIEAAADEAAAYTRETVTGLPARPGTIR